jgi:hypothetical protein
MAAPRPASAPEALLLVTTRCPHCQATLDALARLVKAGTLARLTIVNLDASPQVPEAADVRSVPWTRLGPFELMGAQSAADLARWAELAATGQGRGAYLAHLIETQRLPAVIECVRSQPSAMSDLLNLVAANDTPLTVRIGISAVIESVAGEPALRAAVGEIEALALADSPQVRADACWFLGLAGDPGALPTVRRLLDDEQADVRDVASEVLGILTGAPGD